jgi:hypothetical protein
VVRGRNHRRRRRRRRHGRRDTDGNHGRHRLGRGPAGWDLRNYYSCRRRSFRVLGHNCLAHMQSAFGHGPKDSLSTRSTQSPLERHR